MSIDSEEVSQTSLRHSWLRKMHVAFVPGPMTPLLEEVRTNLLGAFDHLGHEVQPIPDDHTDVILTTALFGKPLSWRQAPLFTARRRFGFPHVPAFFALVHATPTDFEDLRNRLRVILEKEPPDPADYAFPGLAPQAYEVLFEQGRRAGPIMAIERMVQAQAKSIRVILVIGDEQPLAAYFFDLAGAHPRTDAGDPVAFYQDMALRVATTAGTPEINQHQVVGDVIPRTLWQRLSTPAAMRVAGQQLGKRSFFTPMVRIADIVTVPAVADTVASQYSEGCFATWDPILGALIATVTGSARPVDKGKITDDDLAVIVGVRDDEQGALVRHVEGKRNDSPSSESVEMMGVDSVLPTITLESSGDAPAEVPVIRSKLHGHRGIAAYDPRYVEHVALDPPFYHYLVSCATEAQAQGIKGAFARSEALQNPDDPRQVVISVLPGHGVVIVEKWVPGTAPFQVIWEYMDADYLQLAKRVPQGPLNFVPGPNDKMVLHLP